MSQFLGDKTLNDTIYFGFNTHTSSGTPITLAGSPAVKIYKDDSTSTEVTTGVTLVVDFDSLTGYHVVTVVCTDAFYAAAHNYRAIITAGTVDSVSVVGTEVAHWSIQKGAAYAESVLVHAHVGTIDGHVTADYGATEKAAIDLLDDAYTGTMHAAIADAIWEEAKAGHTTGTTFGDLGSEGFTVAVGTGAGEINVSSGKVPATIAAGDLANDSLTAAALKTDAIDEIVDAVWNELTSSHVAVGTFGQRLASIRSGTAQAGSAAGNIILDASASASDDFYTNCLIAITAGTGANQCRTISDYDGGSVTASVTPNWVTTPAVDSVFVIIPMGNVSGAAAPSAADVADAVWDEAKADHTTSTTFGDLGSEGFTISIGTGAGQINASSGKVPATIAAGDLANDSLTAAALKTDAVDEIVDAIWNEATADHTTGTTFGALATSIGTPIALDSGTASIAGMLTKMADDNAGATFDATHDSLNKIHEHVNTIDGHITADYSTTEKAAIDLLDDAIGGLVDIHTDVGTAITAIGDVHTTDLPAVQTILDKLDTALVLDGAVYKYTANALEEVAISTTSAAVIADAVWDEAKADHTTGTTFGDLGQEAFTLADDAITSSKFDESTAFPLKLVDSGSTLILRGTSISFAGTGQNECTYTVTRATDGLPISNATVILSTDSSGANIISSGTTNAFGVASFRLDYGTYYVWVYHNGYIFNLPMTATYSSSVTNNSGTGATASRTSRNVLYTYSGPS